MTHRRRLATIAAAAVALVAAVAVPAAASPGAGGSPGDVIDSRPVVVPLPARATVLRYRSTDTHGRPDVVGGIVLTPLVAPPGPLRLISFAPGTQGLADRCAPSRQVQAGTEDEDAPITSLLAQGYAIAMTDYEGLGTPGEHTYVNRQSQAHAVLDMARAAQRLGVGVPAHGPVALAGYSQGGGASAAAAELAADYAPELDVVGAYAGAVPADLDATARFLDGSASVAFLGYAVSGLDTAYPELGIPGLLNDRGRAFLATLRGQCTFESLAMSAGTRSETLTADGKPVTAYLDRPAIRDRVQEQRIGRLRPRMPVLVVHSIADDMVPYAQGAQLARDWCANGATVAFRPLPVPTHIGAVPAGLAAAIPYLADRFAGRPAPSTC